MKKLFGIACVVAAVIGCGSKDEPGTCLEGAGTIEQIAMPADCKVNTTKSACDTSALIFNRKVEFFVEPGKEGARRCKGLGFVKATSGTKKGTPEVIRFERDGDVERALERGDSVLYDTFE